MRENELNYNEIVNYFGKDRIAERYKFLYDRMQEYINSRGLQSELAIHEGILQQVVMDYYVDIYRLKEFHKLDKVDLVKIVSYTSYWIVRRRPIQVAKDSCDTRLIFANEGFVTTYIAHEMLIPKNENAMSIRAEDSFLKFLKHLNYHLKYRNLDKQSLEIIIYSYQTGQRVCGHEEELF